MGCFFLQLSHFLLIFKATSMKPAAPLPRTKMLRKQTNEMSCGTWAGNPWLAVGLAPGTQRPQNTLAQTKWMFISFSLGSWEVGSSLHEVTQQDRTQPSVLLLHHSVGVVLVFVVEAGPPAGPPVPTCPKSGGGGAYITSGHSPSPQTSSHGHT